MTTPPATPLTRMCPICGPYGPTKPCLCLEEDQISNIATRLTAVEFALKPCVHCGWNQCRCMIHARLESLEATRTAAESAIAAMQGAVDTKSFTIVLNRQAALLSILQAKVELLTKRAEEEDDMLEALDLPAKAKINFDAKVIDTIADRYIFSTSTTFLRRAVLSLLEIIDPERFKMDNAWRDPKLRTDKLDEPDETIPPASAVAEQPRVQDITNIKSELTMNLIEKVKADNPSLFEQERVVFDAGELICAALESTNTTRTKLAEKLGTSKSHITQMLGGNNFTLRTLSDVLFSLGQKLVINAVPLAAHPQPKQPRVQLTCGKCNRIVDELVGEIGRTQVCRSCMNNPQPQQQDQATGKVCLYCNHSHNEHGNGFCRHKGCLCAMFRSTPDQPGTAKASSVSTGDCVRPSAETASVLTEEEQKLRANLLTISKASYFQVDPKEVVAIIDRLVKEIQQDAQDVGIGIASAEQFRALEVENAALKTQLAEATTHIDLLKSSLKHSEGLHESATNEGVDRLLKIKNLESQLAQRDKELAEAKAEVKSCEEQIDRQDAVASECLGYLTKAGFGMNNTPNTLWAMTRDACKEVIQLRQQLTAEKQAAREAKKADALAQAEADVEIERLTTLLDASKSEAVREGYAKGEAMIARDNAIQKYDERCQQVIDLRAELSRLKSTGRAAEAYSILKELAALSWNPGVSGKVFELRERAKIFLALPPDAPRPLLPEGVKLVEMLKDWRNDSIDYTMFHCKWGSGSHRDLISTQAIAALAEAGFAVGEVGNV